YQYMEVCERRFFSTAWLHDLMTTLRDFPGWGVGILNINNGYLLVFGNKLMVNGRPFTNCRDLDSVAAAASTNLATLSGENFTGAADELFCALDTDEAKR